MRKARIGVIFFVIVILCLCKGKVTYSNNDVVLTANNQGVDAKNLHATTYLIIGGNSRMESVTEDGTKRTAVFWIGS